MMRRGVGMPVNEVRFTGIDGTSPQTVGRQADESDNELNRNKTYWDLRRMMSIWMMMKSMVEYSQSLD